MNVELERVPDKDEVLVYMDDDRGYFTYSDGEGIWVEDRTPVCRVPGPVLTALADLVH